MDGDPAGVAALQSICATASRSKGRMLKSIVDSCLKAPNIFVFSELLAIESVQQVPYVALIAPPFCAWNRSQVYPTRLLGHHTPICLLTSDSTTASN